MLLLHPLLRLPLLILLPFCLSLPLRLHVPQLPFACFRRPGCHRVDALRGSMPGLLLALAHCSPFKRGRENLRGDGVGGVSSGVLPLPRSDLGGNVAPQGLDIRGRLRPALLEPHPGQRAQHVGLDQLGGVSSILLRGVRAALLRARGRFLARLVPGRLLARLGFSTGLLLDRLLPLRRRGHGRAARCFDARPQAGT